MVHMNSIINETIKDNKNKIFEYSTVQEFCYWYIVDKKQLEIKSLNDLQGEEEILSAKGYKGVSPDEEEWIIINRPEISKVVHYKYDKYKMLGICLVSDKESQAFKHLESFVKNATVKELFLIQHVYPQFKQNFDTKLRDELNLNSSIKILKNIYFDEFDSDMQDCISELCKQDLDVIDLLILNELQNFYSKQAVQKTTYINQSAKEMILTLLRNFENAVIKITDPKERYGGKTINPKNPSKNILKIDDEYDVQDILYVVLKSVFPTIKYENPLAKLGGSSTRLDFVLIEEGIIIEVKQIREEEKNDKKFIQQIKIDLQSYHVLDYLKEIIFYVYAPKAIQDVNNFYELEGPQTINNKSFDVKIIVVQ